MIKFWLILPSPPLTKELYRGCLWVGSGEDMKPTGKTTPWGTLEELREAFRAMGCDVVNQRIGKVVEIWVENPNAGPS